MSLNVSLGLDKHLTIELSSGQTISVPLADAGPKLWNLLQRQLPHGIEREYVEVPSELAVSRFNERGQRVVTLEELGL